MGRGPGDKEQLALVAVAQNLKGRQHRLENAATSAISKHPAGRTRRCAPVSCNTQDGTSLASNTQTKALVELRMAAGLSPKPAVNQCRAILRLRIADSKSAAPVSS